VCVCVLNIFVINVIKKTQLNKDNRKEKNICLILDDYLC